MSPRLWPGGSTAAGTRAVVKTSAETPIRLWMVTAGLWAMAAALGYLGFTDYLKRQPEFAGAGVFDQVYYTGQLFLLSSTPLNDPPYGPMLSIAMYLAPLATVLAVLEAVSAVFRARFAAWMLLRERGHSVVVGSGSAAFVLARRLAGTRPTGRPCARRACAARRRYSRWTLRVQSTQRWRFSSGRSTRRVYLYTPEPTKGNSSLHCERDDLA